MSRCFPFPPPGYEKKIRTDEADSLIKEKQKKEKKHKKEKKDKERKEGKEKKDKETSKDKHKERKEKKDKHKDRKDKDREKEQSRTSVDKVVADVLPSTTSTKDQEKLGTNNVESKFVHDLARRIKDEEATVSRNAGKVDLPYGVTEINTSCPVPQTNNRKDDQKRINTQSNSSLAKRSEDEVLRGPSCTVPKKNEPKTTRDRSCKEMKDEKTEVINKTGLEKPNFVEGGPRLKEREHDTVDTRNFRVQDLSRASVKNLSSEGILGKRKDLETNGLLYENGSKPNKVQRTGSSPISSVENGRKLGACQNPPKPVSELQGKVCNPEAKEHRTNGFIDSQDHKSHAPVSSVKVKEKRPHSDLKYLDQILNVPKREELREVGNNEEQEWLFGQSGVKLLKKQRADSLTSLDETLQVWNQALRIESADIVALPYVVPF